MSLFTTASRSEGLPIVKGDGLFLRPPVQTDYEAWAELRARSRSHLTPWEPTWPADDLTRPAFRRRLRNYAQDLREDKAYPFFVFREADEALLGACTLSNIRRGVAQACALGYWCGAPYAGQGVTTRAVRALIPFVFDTLRLHRLEAACLPTNIPSQKLLRRLGFTEEGMARAYLRIDGKWQDHLLFALLESDPRV